VVVVEDVVVVVVVVVVSATNKSYEKNKHKLLIREARKPSLYKLLAAHTNIF